MGIGSKDCRSKVFRGVNNYFDPNPTNVQTWHNGPVANFGYTGTDAMIDNNIIGISFSAGSLAAGDSTSFVFTYILNAADFNEALANTAPGFSVNNISYNSNDTVLACANSTIPVSLTNAEDYAWSWLPAAGVSPATGTTVNIALGNIPVQYIATGTGPCGIIKDTVNILPLAAKLYVDSSVVASGDGSSWVSPLKTVSEALNLVNNNDCASEIWVKRGTYFPMRNATTIATSVDSAFRIVRNGIKLYGGFAGTETLISQRITGANTTILSGNIGVTGSVTDNSRHVVTIFNAFNVSPINSDTRLDGFTIKDGHASAHAQTPAIFYNGHNLPRYMGGGIYNMSCSPHISNCIIENNSATYTGGGIYSTLGNAIFENIGVINNRMTMAPSEGAGIGLFQDTSLFKNSVISGNTTNSIGGGIGSRFSRAKFLNILVENNRAAIGAGFGLGGNGADSLINVTIRGNRASVVGGAVYNANNTIFINGLITGNLSESMAGWANQAGDPLLTNVTIAHNNSTGNNAGVGINAGNLNVKNCIIWGNQAATDANILTAPAATFICNNSNIEGSTIYPGTGNINSNPFFIAPAPAASAPTTLGNYRLDPCQSRSIDAGDNTANNLPTDIDGNARIQNAMIDMGAYETSAIIYDVSIASNPAMATPVCGGTNIIFTATPVNPGTNPTYQWLLNGNPIPLATSATYSSTSLLNGDIISVVLTPDHPCTVLPDTSNAIIANITSSLTPSVSIVASDINICAGTSISFTATPVNGGASPFYQWKVNGANAGTNSAIFTSATLTNNDVITVELSSSETCVTTNNVMSNSIVMQVTNIVTPSVTIAASQINICAGTAVTFTATAVNDGSNPVYQWKINGANAGTNSNIFTTSTLNNNDVVNVELTNNDACVTNNTVASNPITITVGNNILPTISIAASANNICAGTPVTFTATATGQGNSPIYQWQVNGSNLGTNSSTFISSSLNNNDAVSAVLTSSQGCLSGNNIQSNSISMLVNPMLTPSVSITASNQNICAGVNVNFTATAINGGSNPVYQWKLNGANVGSNSNTFSSATLNNNDVVSVVLTSNTACLTVNNVSSNSITMQVNPNVTPAVNITASNTLLCGGETATFTATSINAGNNPVYQWQINGAAVGTNSNQFTWFAFNNNDVVNVILTSNAACFTTNPVTSNSININIAPNPVLTLSADNTEILAGGVTQLHTLSTQPIATYSWQPATTLSNPAIADPLASPLINTVYTLNATSDAGCKASASIEIKVVKGPIIANTFSPNGDGINELWLIKNLETYPNCRVQVFTRAGQLVFESRGYRQPWNGTFKGKPLPVDTYYYILELNNRIGSQPITGYVTILK
ncbi:MAG: T9SS type B sorting domain-containing protein [Sphingobacteriales bacterium]|nr:MAG: T9SS type B sorting domain-containing protein [Sphingobacteriales bacterium]